MELRESDEALSYICRSIEGLTEGISDLKDLVLPVELLSNFYKEPGAQKSKFIQNSPTVYRLSDRKILVDRSKFFGLKAEIAKIALIHEVGHAYCHLKGQAFCNHARFAELHEDQVVDLLLCRWGFEEQLIAERKNSYGKEYCEALRLWRDETKYIKTMARYRLKRLVGIC
jgi:hypothetical protein